MSKATGNQVQSESKTCSTQAVVARTVQITPEFKKYRTKITRKDINTQKI